MRLAVFTTETLHHTYLVRELARDDPGVVVFEETRAVVPPFPTAHEFEKARNAHERDTWFGGKESRIADFAEVYTFETLNSPAALSKLRAIRPDLVVVFGTGRLSAEVIKAMPPGTLLNVHGGDPEEYRGLDTHLWAIYHGEFAALVTTLHFVAPALDTGDVVSALPVPLRKGMTIAELRATNSEVALRLSREAIERFKRDGRLAARAQRKRGRYYSFMPAVIKAMCVDKFNQHCSKLP